MSFLDGAFQLFFISCIKQSKYELIIVIFAPDLSTQCTRRNYGQYLEKGEGNEGILGHVEAGVCATEYIVFV